MDKKTLGIIKFQRLYKNIKSELDTASNLLDFYKNIFISMCINLNLLNNKDLYDNNNDYYNNLYKLNKINIFIKTFPKYYSLTELKETNIDEILLKIHQLSNLIIKNFNYIAPNKLDKILETLLTSDWFYHFDNKDLEILYLLIKIFNPISIWDSDYHKNMEEEDNQKLPSNGRELISKQMIEGIIENKDNSITSIIVGEISLPSFLKNLTNISKNNLKNQKSKNNLFNYVEVLSNFDKSDSNILLTTNNKSSCLLEEKHGLNIYLKIKSKLVVIQGYILDDMFNINLSNDILKNKLINIKKNINYGLQSVPKGYKKNYINNLNLRDILVIEPKALENNLKKKFSDYNLLKGKELLTVINDFLLSNKFRKYEILTILLLGNDTDNKLAFLLYDILKHKDKKNIYNELFNSLNYDHKIKIKNIKDNFNNEENDLLKLNDSDISYEKRITFMKVDDKIKAKAVDKLKSFKNNFQGDNKAQSWLDGILKIPFNIYKENSLMTKKQYFIENIYNEYNEKLFSVNQIENFIDTVDNDKLFNEWAEYKKKKSNYLKNVKTTLDKSVYGHEDAKNQIERLFGQWLNGETKGAVLGLWGPPGTGKTSLAKRGIANCLIDDNNEERPFAFLPIGGSTNGSTLVGHNYTYVGSTWGRIVDILIDSKCMNPIIFIDEIDKVSQTEHGKEIISILTHLTDSTQNDNFEDKYFSGIPFDLSKALIVFSFNDLNYIDPILKDRITIIETKAFTLEEKIIILKDHVLPEIKKDIGFSDNEIIFSDEILEYIINTYTNEAGVRKIKEKLIEILRDINLKCIHDTFDLPFIVSKEYISKLFEDKPKMRIKTIPSVPSIGLVNGLYATTTGIGGLTVIQVMKYPSDKMLELSITGQQGDVMKESCEYAKRIAYSLLSDEEKDQILKDTADKKCFGIHIHTPDAATKKDGPSAGAAMTLAIYSILTDKKVNNEVALTGEIDLCKNVTAIGGVYAKLNGAKKAGVKKALIPKENLEDLEILRNKNMSPEDDDFKVYTIESIEQVLEHCLI